MGHPTSKVRTQVDADDEFHLADTEEMEQLNDLDTDVLATLKPGEDGESSDNPGCDPYNNTKTR